MLKEFSHNIFLISFFTILTSFLLVYLIIPRIRWVIVNLGLHDHPDERSSHKTCVPTLAGISFFITLIIITFFIQNFDTDKIGLNLIAAVTLVFIVGLKDDLVTSSPRSRLVMEILAILFLLFSSHMQVVTFDGFLHLYELPKSISYPGVILLLLSIINGYNFIDGLDGLASIIAIIIFSIFALIFFDTTNYFYFLICLSFIGMLGAYLIYNFSNSSKIFMGDTGSLIIGFCIGFCSLKYLAMDIPRSSFFYFNVENELLVLVGILWMPLFDLVRVIGVRLLNGKNPFYPDRNHIHHILVDCGMAHYKIALLLGVSNCIIIVLILSLSYLFNYIQMIGVLVFISVALLSVFHKLKLRNQLGLIEFESGK